MFVALGGYGTAALLDWRYRRVPNVVWVGLLVLCLWRGVTLSSVVWAVVLFALGVYGWRSGEIGGADAKGTALVPLALPEMWPLAIAVGFGLALAWFRATGRDELPLFVPVCVGVAVAIGVS